jgi:hypothetical protein
MKSLTADPPTSFCLMLVGNAGSGKSSLAALFPKPFFLSLDKNLRGVAALMQQVGKSDISYEDNFDTKEDNSPILAGFRYNRFAEVLSAAATLPDIETLVIDNTTILSDYIIDDILRQQGRKAMEIRDWGLYAGCWKQLVAKLRACRKNVIIITHERVEKDELDGQLKYFLAIPGQSADILPTLVTDVWRCEIEEKIIAQQKVHVRQVRAIQSQRFAHLKSSTPSMPNVFPATQDEVNKVLKTIKK